MDASRRWQRGIETARLVLILAGITLYLLIHGNRPWWAFSCFMAGLGAVELWLRYARPYLRRQALLVLLMLAYVLTMPVVATGPWIDLILVAGMLFPVTLAAAALYFGVFSASREHPSQRTESKRAIRWKRRGGRVV